MQKNINKNFNKFGLSLIKNQYHWRILNISPIYLFFLKGQDMHAGVSQRYMPIWYRYVLDTAKLKYPCFLVIQCLSLSSFFDFSNMTQFSLRELPYELFLGWLFVYLTLGVCLVTYMQVYISKIHNVYCVYELFSWFSLALR